MCLWVKNGASVICRVIQRRKAHSQIHHEMQNFILVRLNTKRSHYLAASGWASITSMMERCPHNRFWGVGRLLTWVEALQNFPSCQWIKQMRYEMKSHRVHILTTNIFPSKFWGFTQRLCKFLEEFCLINNRDLKDFSNNDKSFATYLQ